MRPLPVRVRHLAALLLASAVPLAAAPAQSAQAADTGSAAQPDTGIRVRVSGDLRGRFDGIYGSQRALEQRQRFRYRARAGVLADLPRGFELELGLTSSDEVAPFGGDPISGNTSLGDNGSKKGVFVDLAYLRWTPQFGARPLSLVFGKMENPFELSDLVFDGDYTPEGGALSLDLPVARGTGLRLATAAFVLDETRSDTPDPYLVGGQLQLAQALGARASITAGGGLLRIVHPASLANSAVPNSNAGNTRNAAGELVFDYAPSFVHAELEATTLRAPGFAGGLPVRLGGEWLRNPDVDDRGTAWSVSATLGDAADARTWDVRWRYKHLERDAWYEEMVDSDFGAFYAAPLPGSDLGAGYRAGTNTRGHVVRVQVAPYDFAVLAVTLFDVRLVDFADPAEGSDTRRLQVDVTLRF